LADEKTRFFGFLQCFYTVGELF